MRIHINILGNDSREKLRIIFNQLKGKSIKFYIDLDDKHIKAMVCIKNVS